MQANMLYNASGKSILNARRPVRAFRSVKDFIKTVKSGKRSIACLKMDLAEILAAKNNRNPFTKEMKNAVKQALETHLQGGHRI